MAAPRTAAATAARRQTALRRRLAAYAAELRQNAYIVVTRQAACDACRRVNDATRPRP